MSFGQRGDTIIEVVFAITIFSMAAIGSLSLMRQGTAMAQRSLEIEQVRSQIDMQADMLRYLHNAYIKQNNSTTTTIWQSVSHDIVGTMSTTQDFSAIGSGGTCIPQPTAGSGTPFALDTTASLDTVGAPLVLKYTSTNQIVTPSGVAQVKRGQSEGIWIQAVQGGSATGIGYYDFHIVACWLTPGQSVPVTLGTIVRLYDPAA